MSGLIDLESSAGQKLLLTATYKQNAIIENFAKQTHRTFCAIRTATITMSAMQQPGNNQNVPYKEETMFDLPQTVSVLNREAVAAKGCTLQEMADLYRAFQYDVKVYYASDSSCEQFQQVAIETLSSTDCRCTLIVNYHMRVLGQDEYLGGHISPVAAYHQETDRLLLMDVWADTQETWTTTKDLYRAMNTEDTVSHKSRGFIVVYNKREDGIQTFCPNL